MLNTLITTDFSFTQKEDNKWLFEHSDKYFIISNEIKSLLEILKRNQNNYDDSYLEFIEEFDYVSKEEFESIIQENLENLELNQNQVEKKEKSFILFETKVISAPLAGKISKLFQPLFQPIFFWVTFTLLLILSIYNTTQGVQVGLKPQYIFYFFLFYLSSSIIHEFGHVAACNKFTKKNGEIGIGIYFIFPIFFSNISPIWKASKNERIITNLAGVYLQLIILLFLYIIFLITKNEQIQVVIIFSTFIILYQLVPFIRSDGYWILSDLTDSPNLLNNSVLQVKRFIKNPFKFRISKKIEILEITYGIINQILMIYIIYSIISFYKTKLISFPIEIFKTIFTQPSTLYTLISINFQLLITSVVFYLIIYNQLKSIFTKKAN